MISPMPSGAPEPQPPRYGSLPGAKTVRFEELAVGQLLQSPGNKREFREKVARGLASKFDLFYAGTIAVSYRDGKYWVIDGWTRVGAARFADRPTVSCMVGTGMTVADEALAFDILNTIRTRISAAHEFWSRIDYGEPVATMVKAVCDNLGVALINRSPVDASATRAYAALQTIVARHGPKILQDTLTILRKVWPDEPRALEATTILWIGGFLALYADHPNFHQRKFVDRLMKVSVATFWQKVQTIRGARSAQDGGGNASFGPPAARMVLVDIYNKQVTVDRRLPEATPGDIKRRTQGKNPWV